MVPASPGGVLPGNGVQPLVAPLSLPPAAPPAPVAAPPAAQTPDQAREQAQNEQFMRALQGLMPLTPEQVRRTRQAADAVGDAAARPSTQPRPVTRSVSLTLRPGEPLPTVRTFVGNATTLTFADQSGAAWPIASVTSGNPGAVAIIRAGSETQPSNIAVLSPLQQFAFANNVVITLQGNPVPIVIGIQTGGSPEVDFRVDFALRGRGPNAASEPLAMSQLAPTNDAVMQAFVDGLAPQGARRLSTSRPDVEAWRHEDVMYVRTSLELLSPAATARASHVSGVRVFALVYSPVLVLSQNGQQVRVSVDERSDRGRGR